MSQEAQQNLALLEMQKTVVKLQEDILTLKQKLYDTDRIVSYNKERIFKIQDKINLTEP